jgi:replicative DNA helicase
MSVQSEQSVLGSLLQDNRSFDYMGDLTASSFIREDHRTIFSAIKLILEDGKPVDAILLADALEARNELDRVGGLPYIGSLIVNTSKNIKHHAKLITDAYILRKLKISAEEISLSCDNKQDPKEIAEEAERKILAVLDNSSMEREFVHIGSAVAEAVEWEDTDHTGLPTGLRDLDRLTGGFGRSNLIILAGRPSMGKTSLVMQVAEHISQNQPAAVFSLEMSRREVAGRMLKYHSSRVDRSSAVSYLYGLNMQIDDTPAVSVHHIRSRCRRIKRLHGLSLIVVDYLQLMRGDGDNRNQEIGSISRGLKSIAKEFDVPVIALSQLSRKVEDRADRRPIMSDLRESGEIEQDADLILFVYRDEVYNENSDAKGTAEIICRKNRHGAIGDCRTTFDGSYTRFGNYDGPRIERVSTSKASHGFIV